MYVKDAVRVPYNMLCEISKGELIDKITILEIKSERIGDPDKLKNVRTELDALRCLEFPTPTKLELKTINQRLWDVEDSLRIHEKNGDFGPVFIEKARSVYTLNDERSRLKREINVCHGSEIIEEKSY